MSIRADIEALMAGYVAAFSEKDARGCAAIYAEDAVIHSPWDAPVEGRAAIVATHESWFDLGEENKRIDVVACGVSGDLGWCLARYSADVPGKDGQAHEEAGTNLCVLVRDGEDWRILQSSMNEEASQ